MTAEPTAERGRGSSTADRPDDSPTRDATVDEPAAEEATGETNTDAATRGTTAGAGPAVGDEDGSRPEVGSGTFEPGPSNLGRGLTLFAGLLASVSLAPALPAVGLGVLGTSVLAYGLRARSGRTLGAGVATLVVALLVGGVLGTPAELLVLAAAATILAWDVGDNALSVGEQLGRNARTARLELVHAAASLAVGVIGSAAAYAVYRLVGGGHPILAVVLLLLGATILVTALR